METATARLSSMTGDGVGRLVRCRGIRCGASRSLRGAGSGVACGYLGLLSIAGCIRPSRASRARLTLRWPFATRSLAGGRLAVTSTFLTKDGGNRELVNILEMRRV